MQLDTRFFTQALTADAHALDPGLPDFHHAYLEILDRQRTLLHDMNRRTEFDEELIRKYLALLDLEEYKLREKQLQSYGAQVPQQA